MAKTFLRLEALNSRALPSATFTNGVLTITGTDGRDKVEVREIGDQLVVKGQKITVGTEQVRSIDTASVTRIEISTGAGDDKIDLRKTSAPAVVDAGDGRDEVRGGTGDDTITGGAGDDRLSGGRGNDVIDGGDGDDRITGQRDDDHLNGEAGDDSVLGGLGDDNCDGGAGDDRVRGGHGSDDCSGGTGNDDVVDGTSFHGTITAIDLSANQVTVRRASGVEVVVSINASTELERNDADVTLAAFQVGDRVEVSVGADGFAAELETDDHAGDDDDGRGNEPGDDNGGGGNEPGDDNGGGGENEGGDDHGGHHGGGHH